MVDSDTTNVDTTTEENDYIMLSVTEKVLRSNTNNDIKVPSMTHLNLILNKIVFNVVENIWEFEISIKCGGTELIKLQNSYFKHHNEIDLAPYINKICDGDKVELVVKPKHCPKDIHLELSYYYVPNNGVLYYQNTIRLTDFLEPTNSLMSDLTQQMNPTKIEIKTDVAIKGYRLTPKFKSTTLCGPDYTASVDYIMPDNKIIIDFTEDDFPSGVLNMLKFYHLELKLDLAENFNSSSTDCPIYILAYGFKNI